MAREYPLVALVGRPNVGKSTLFNRLIGRKIAVVHDKAGTTRDRQQAETQWNGVTFTVVDTGGIERPPRGEDGQEKALAEDSVDFVSEIRDQALIAIREADMIVFVLDITTGITAADDEVAQLLRRADKPVVVAINKTDNPRIEQDIYEFYNLGMGEVYGISSIHGYGTGDLLDAVVEALPQHKLAEEEDDDRLKIALLGRPNVGKSSLLNRLLGEERVIVSPVAGTTRDSIDTTIRYNDEEIVLIDTAGIRKRGKIERGVEKWSVLRSLKAIKRADVCLLVLDATDGITSQDAHIAGFILEELKSVIVLVNKWDVIEKDEHTIIEWEASIREKLKFMPYVPIQFISALTGQRINRLMPLIIDVFDQRFTRIPTSEINKIVRDAMAKQAPPSRQGRRLKIRYASQVSVDPPKLLFHINDMRLLHFSYERYLENTIRSQYPFVGTPLNMVWKETRRSKPK